MDEKSFTYSDLEPHLGHAQDSQNIALATALHSSVLRQTDLFDGGVNRARFAVLRDIKIPGALLQGVCINHPLDEDLIASSQFRDAFARAILEGVGRFRNAISGSRCP